jgi:hypothetical protein
MLVIFFILSSLAQDCAKDITALRALLKDESMPLVWVETTADDGKPLVVTISELGRKLHLDFNKTKEGLWASGGADICAVDGKVIAHITKDHIRLGKAAHWVVKMSMSGGAKFTLKYSAPDKLHISTFGWKGDFVPQKKEAPPVLENTAGLQETKT